MSTDTVLDEEESPLIVGPINKMRWIYSCGKQMLDRVIAAYGQEKGLRYTLFRPFNWIGPRLDTFRDAEERTARSITQNHPCKRRRTAPELYLCIGRDRCPARDPRQ